MASRTRIETVPAPAITAGIVNTPVPMMLPMTRAVADGRPSARTAPWIGVRVGAWCAALVVADMLTTAPLARRVQRPGRARRIGRVEDHFARGRSDMDG